MNERPSFDVFFEQATKELGFSDSKAAERRYQFNMRSAHQSVESSDITRKIVEILDSLSIAYAKGRPDLLFMHGRNSVELRFNMKPFRSAMEKIYRRTILYNRQYPDPPNRDKLRLSNFYTEIDDLIRTKVICRYMDGPKYICNNLAETCDALGIECGYRDLSTDAGYYAWHFYFQTPVPLMITGDVEEAPMWVEIQLATQLSDVISTLTHDIYKTRRSSPPSSTDTTWKWDSASREFKSAYLGHGLHLLEGVVQGLKDEVLGSAGGGKTDEDGSSAAGTETQPEPAPEAPQKL